MEVASCEFKLENWLSILNGIKKRFTAYNLLLASCLLKKVREDFLCS